MEAKDEIKQRLDIVEIVGEYLQLKPAGSNNFKGLCPFHHEKTPSLHVSRDKEIWHCFGCDKGGDLISFVMEIEGMTFIEALRHLGKKAGVEVPEIQTITGSNEKQFILGLHELAQKFYQKILIDHPLGQKARDYLKERQIDDDLVLKFNLGYAPDKWDALTSFLKKRGFAEKRLIESGLVKPKRSGNGVVDRFRDRLMIPLADSQGNTVGFTGRILTSLENAPKYLNSPETLIYHKSDVLYGLHLAKQAIRKNQSVIVVEGNLDVIASHKAGVENVVASSGTALTNSQLKQLKKLTSKIIFSFDADAAGFAAAKRGIQLAQAMDFDIGVIQIPSNLGKDPDDVVKQDPKRWLELSQTPIHIMDYYFNNAMKTHDLTKIEDKRAMAHALISELAKLNDPVEIEHWMQKLSDTIHVEGVVLRKMMESLQTKDEETIKDQAETKPVKKMTSKSDQALRFLIGLMLNDPTYITQISAGLDDRLLPDDSWGRIYKDLVLLYTANQLPDSAPKSFFSHARESFIEQNRDEDATRLNASAIVAAEAIADCNREQVRHEITRHIQVLASVYTDVRRKKLEAAIRQAESSGDEARLKALIEQYKKLL